MVAFGTLVSGQFVTGLTIFAIVVLLSSLALMAANAKCVMATGENLIVQEGIWTRETISIPLEKIDKIVVNSAYVRVSAGTIFNRVDLFVTDPSHLAAKLEKARSEIQARHPLPAASKGSTAASPPQGSMGEAIAESLTKKKKTATWLVIGVIASAVLGISQCTTRETACSEYSGSLRLTCERLAGECLKSDNMTQNPGCRAGFPNGY
jgi:hypothetical protein